MGARRGRWFRTYLETKTWIWTGDRGEIEVDEGETRKKDSLARECDREELGRQTAPG